MKKIKLFCIAHAGGSVSVFYQWKSLIKENITLMPFELAGRGGRFGEPLYKSWDQAIQDVYKYIVNNINDESYAILGHSMGSWIAFDVVSKIKKNGLKEPEHIFFSGNTPPHIPYQEEKISHLTEEEFIKKIKEKGDTPDIVFEDNTLRELLLPVIKSDYHILEEYNHTKKSIQFNSSIHVMYGKRDILEESSLKEWNKYAIDDFDMHSFEGGHMFINNNKEETIQYINRVLMCC